MKTSSKAFSPRMKDVYKRQGILRDTLAVVGAVDIHLAAAIGAIKQACEGLSLIHILNNSTATLDYMRKVRTVFCPDFLAQS